MSHQRALRPSRWPTATASLAALGLAVGASAQIQTGGRGGGLGGPTSNGPITGGTTQADPEQIQHVLNRLTYGATEEERDRIRQLGVEDYIRLQLNPGQIPEDPILATKLSQLAPRFNPIGDPRWDWTDLYGDHILRARYSSRQLNEVMTEFWSNHFDTGLDLGNGGIVGYYSDLEFDPVTGNPAVAYYDLARKRPGFARWSGTVWQPSDVENTNLNGWFTSLEFNPVTNEATVCYYSERYQRLQYHTFDGTRWSVENVVDAAGNVGWYSSLGFDSTGTAWIAYYDLTNQQLKVSFGGPGMWTTEVVETGTDVGHFASLAIDPSTDRPAIAYVDLTADVLKYAARNGGGRWQVEVADPNPGSGRFASLAFDGSANPAIAYLDTAGRTMRLATKRGTWSSQLVDGVNPGGHASLAYDRAGLPAIAYHRGAPDYDLMLARFDGTRWNLEVVEATTAITGEWASLAFDPTGQPAIGFFNGTTYGVRYNRWQGSAWLRQNVYSYGTTRFLYTVWEALETDGFRANALGSFRDLLEVSATSAGMMFFLNNDLNTAGNGNENYARELLELHTVGVNGGYTQLDVETTARAFTGWGTSARSSRCDVLDDYFCYNHLGHDGTAKTILGVDFAADSATTPLNWMKQGHEILDFLARHPATAKFICSKLIAKFVADQPPPRLWQECQEAFLQSDGDIHRVMESILLSKEFLDDPAYRLSKVRDPFEFAMAAVRNLEGDTSTSALWGPISSMGMPLFRQDVPTGWPEDGISWISTNSFLQRWRFADQLTHTQIASAVYEPYMLLPTAVDPFGMVRPTDLKTADGVVEFFVQRLLNGQASGEERAHLIDCVSNGSPSTFNIDDPATPSRMRDMIGVMLGYPLFNKH